MGDLEANIPTAVSPPTLHTVTVNNPSPSSTVGVGLIDKFGAPVVSSIDRDGLFAGTALEQGMQVYTINGTSCKGKDATAAMLKVASGSVVVAAGPPGLLLATVKKPTKDSKVGIDMKSDSGSHNIIISGVTPGGLFASTGIHKGVRLLKVNGADCVGMPLEKALESFAVAEGDVTVLAYDPIMHDETALKGQPSPPGKKAGGMWGSTTYIGPLTWALALASFYTVIGPILILLFLPVDQRDVYKIDGKLYLPNGNLLKSASDSNFEVRKSEHVTHPTKKGGRWCSTSYVGALTFAMAIVSAWTVVVPALILLFMPMDRCDVYLKDNKLYKASGEYFKPATKHNTEIRESKHL